ncbi:zinc-binding alcohol dehydrogenase family protein [Eionea flava]
MHKENTMKAIGYINASPITDDQSLQDITLEKPSATGRDLLVKVHAIAVNPVDCKIRQKVSSGIDAYKVIGWDAVGEVVATGNEVGNFSVGDRVYYAGDLTRQGSNAEYQLVDERIVAKKPETLTNAEAAAMPLTAITAWELLFDRLGVQRQSIAERKTSDEVILIVGAAGGVGSILIQLAKVICGATIIATASRESSQAWVKKLGADYVIDHTQPLPPQVDALAIAPVTHVVSLHSTEAYLDAYAEIVAPFGKIGLIDDPGVLDIRVLKQKSISLHWEFMYTRSMYQTEDMPEQHALLKQVAQLIDDGHIKTTIGKHMGVINAANLKAAHTEIESGRSIGKIVLEGF